MPVFPQPKPTRRDRPHGRIDTRGLLLPKLHPVREDDYRAHVRESGPCWLLNFEVPCGRKPERGETECAHLPYSDQHGTGLKVSDAACACLCPVHHDRLDAHTLPYQIIAFLWMRALFLRERWWQSRGKS